MKLGENIKKLMGDFAELYESLKQVIVDAGGYICTIDSKCDRIYSLEFTDDGEAHEWNVLAVKVEGDDILYCAEYQTWENEKLTEEELFAGEDNNRQWYSLANTDNYYIQTIFNIAESIEQYID